MPTKKNKHGLPRYIPAPIRRTIRQDCGFGCLICGCAIYHYEHIDPEWHAARDHLPSKMALLCGGCHSKVNKKIWSKDKIKEARNDPYCLRAGASHYALDVASGEFKVRMGAAIFVDPKCVLSIFGCELLRIAEPEQSGAPPRVYGEFYDSEGARMFRIDDNEFMGDVSNWDIETVGPVTTIRRKEREIALRFRMTTRSSIEIERLDMWYKGARVIADTGGVTIANPANQSVQFHGSIYSAETCIQVSNVS